jgi:hypothetical protein
MGWPPRFSCRRSRPTGRLESCRPIELPCRRVAAVLGRNWIGESRDWGSRSRLSSAHPRPSGVQVPGYAASDCARSLGASVATHRPRRVRSSSLAACGVRNVELVAVGIAEVADVEAVVTARAGGPFAGAAEFDGLGVNAVDLIGAGGGGVRSSRRCRRWRVAVERSCHWQTWVHRPGRATR